MAIAPPDNRDLPSAPDIRALANQLIAAEEDARRLVAGLSAELGTRRPAPGAWSIAECLDHLATANRVYVDAMREPARRARTEGRFRRRPALPGILGGLFARSFEPPPTRWSTRRAPRQILPRPSPPLEDAFTAFVASQAHVSGFLRENADLDLATIHFPNPFVRVIHWSIATGLHVITAHERRHLWQAWSVRGVLERRA
jgi:hypothetical protein